MIAGFVSGGNLRPRGKCTERKAIRNTLCRDQNIGFDAVVFDGKHFSGTAKAGLNFVGNEEDAMAVENFLHFFEIIRRRDDDPAFAHDRLGDECSHVIGSREPDHVLNGPGALPSAFFRIVRATASDRHRAQAQRSRRRHRVRRASCVPCCR